MAKTLISHGVGEPPPFPGEFLRGVIGSTIHGLSVASTDDLDLMGVYLEPLTDRVTLRDPIEGLEYRTQPQGSPSGPGDVDLSVYTLSKYLRLAANGNPTIINLLFVPESALHIDTALGRELRGLTPQIVSLEAAKRYWGYMVSQRERLIGIRGQKRTGETRQQYYISCGDEVPWDAKFGMHMIRLGIQGLELMSSGKITLPMVEPMRSRVANIRRGLMTQKEVIEWELDLEIHLDAYIDGKKEAAVAPHPDRVLLNEWMQGVYLDHWVALSK